MFSSTEELVTDVSFVKDAVSPTIHKMKFSWP